MIRLQANLRGKGFYRVLYTNGMLDRLGPAVRAKQLSAADRVGIISDGITDVLAPRALCVGGATNEISLTGLRGCGGSTRRRWETAFALSYAGALPTVDTLNLLANYANEDDFVVWDELASSLGNLRCVWFWGRGVGLAAPASLAERHGKPTNRPRRRWPLMTPTQVGVV